MVQNEMQQTKELEVRMMNASKNYASSMTRNHEVSNQVINLDSLYLNGPIQVGPTPLVQPNIAFFPWWQATQPNMIMSGIFNMVQPISNQVGFYPRPLVGNTSYMPVNVSNLFVATPKGKQVQMNMLTNILLHR